MDRIWQWRVLTVLAMGAAVLFGTAAVAGAQEAPDHTAVQAELDFAELRWGFSNIDDYEITYVVTCFCPAPLPEVTVVVEGGVVISATSSDGADVLNPRTVPAMFEEIQGEIDRPAASISAEFDNNGRPSMYSFDIDEMIADEEYAVTIVGFTNNEFVQLQAQLDAAVAQWAAQAPATDNYSLAYRVICFCPSSDPQRIEVRNGDVIERTDNGFPGPAKTVEELFALIQSVIDGEQGAASVEFDPITGVPMVISLDPVPGAVDDETTYQVTSFDFVASCCDPIPTLVVASSCVAENGRIDVSFVSTTLADGPVEHAIHIGSLAPRLHTVLSGETVTEVATGRPDGPLVVELRIDGVVVTSATVQVDCDPDRPEVEVDVSCLAENGRFDIYLTAPPLPGVAQRQEPIPPLPFQYEVELAAPGRPSILRSAGLLWDETRRVTITGRPDDDFTVRVARNGGDIFNEAFTVDCDFFDQPVVLTVSCLGTNGRFDVDLFNIGAASATYVVSVTPLADRTRTLDAGASTRVTYTGRPDTPSTISVVRDGLTIFRDTVTPNCDPVCDAGYSLVGDRCVTPNANCEAPLLELETIGGAAIVDPITGEITASITYSCVTSCDPPAGPSGPGRCLLALP